MKQSNLFPNASIEDYYLYWLKGITENCSQGVVGYIGNSTNDKLKIRVEIDDVFMEERNHPNLCFCFDFDDYIANCSIVMTSSFFHKLETDDCLICGLWHEVGHFHTIHYFDTDFNNKSTSLKRGKYYEQGKVMEEEQAADLFSVYYTSKESWIKHIRLLIRNRYNMEWDEKRFMAVNEMRDRRKMIERIETEEQLQNKLCELCNISNFQNI